MITVNTKQAKEFEADLKAFAHRAYPFATKNTLNEAAFKTREFYQSNARQELTLRNTHTVRSILVKRTNTLNVQQQAAVVGSTAPYMEDLEFGETKTKHGKKGIPIVTGYAARQKGQKPRTKLPTKSDNLANISLKRHKRRHAKNRKQALLFAVQDAVSSGNRYFFFDFGEKQGIFRVLGGSKRLKLKRGFPKGASIEMVVDLSEQQTTIRKRPLLGPATDKVIPMIPSIHEKSLRFQVERQGLFR